MNKIVKVISFILLSLIVLGILFTIFTQTSIFKTWLTNKAIAYAQNYINGKIELKALTGNPFSYFQLEGLSIQVEDEPIIKVQRVFIRYSPLSLIFKKLAFSQIILETPELHLTQQDDKTWNLAKLLKSTGTSRKAKDSQNLLKFNWEIELPKVQIISGRAELKNIAWYLPQKIKNIQLNLGLWFSEGRFKLSLEKLSFDTQEPNLLVQTIHSNVKISPDSLIAQDFEIKTESSKLTSKLDVKNFKNPYLHFFIKGYPISFAEIRRAVPVLMLYGNPKLDLEARGTLDDLDINCNIWVGRSKIEILGNLQVRDLPYGYNLKGKVTNLNLAEITNQPDLASNLNFSFKVIGKSIEWGDINAEFLCDFDSSYAGGKYLRESTLNLAVKGDSLNFFGDALIEGTHSYFSGKFVPNKELQIKGKIQDLDLGRFVQTNDVTTDLNLDFNLVGRGLKNETLSGNLSLIGSSSHINQVPIDSAFIELYLKNQILNLKAFTIFSPLVKIFAAGDVSIQKENHLKFDAKFMDFSVLTKALPIDSLWGKGNLSGRLEGPLDSLVVQANLDLTQVGTEDLNIAQFQGNFSGMFSNSEKYFQFKGDASEAAAFGLTDLSANFTLDYLNALSNFVIEVQQGDNVFAETQGKFGFESGGYWAKVQDLGIKIFGQNWEKVNPETEIHFVGSEISVSQLVLASEDQSLNLFGRFDSRRNNDFTLKLTNLDISKFGSLFGQEVDFEGRLNFETIFSGTLERPNLQGEIKIEQLRYSKVPFKNFSGNFNYQGNSFFWKCLLFKTESDSLLESSGFLPVKFSLAPFDTKLLEEAPLEIKISTQGLELSFLQFFSKTFQNIGGTLVADVVLSNSLNDLRGVGPIRLIHGNFDIPELGTKYRNVNIDLVLKGKELVIKDFRIRSGDGELMLVEGSLSLSKKSLENFHAHFRVKNFYLMNNKKMRAKVKGDIQLFGSIQAPEFTGELTINQARIYYPAWLKDETAVELSEKPYFVIPTDSVVMDTAGALRFQKSFKGVESQISETQFYKNLRGDLSFYFPRNTWIRSQQANIEVEGELVPLKEGPVIVLFGAFSAIRGYYDLLGHRFQIKEGELVFNGELEPNPEIYLEAMYEFQDLTGEEPQKHEIKVLVTGTLQFPQFKFTLDNQEADQKDILSFLLFGRSFDELTLGQRSSVSDEFSLESKATGFLAGQVLKRLTSKLGSELSLDVIQIESGKNLSDAKVRIGKYVTPDVFVSVSQDFGAEGDRKVELEYEIPKKILFFNLLLQASRERKGDTALDVIWKIEW